MNKKLNFKTFGFRLLTFFFIANVSNLPVVQAKTDKAGSQVFSINIVDKSLPEALDEIGKKSGYSFFYYDGLLNSGQRVNLSTTNLTLHQTLERLFANSDNTYSIDGKQVFIKKAPKPAAAQQTKAQESKLSGRVLTTDNAPISGATVIVQGTTSGVVTNSAGEFVLNNIQLPAVLVVSFLGYESQTILATQTNKTSLVVRLKEEAQEMDDVVVVGYGTQRRALISSAISTMKIDESNQRQVASPGQLLDGRIAGVTISTGSGNLGTGERMSIRGTASINAGNEPLYVIDGIPITNSNANIYNFGETMSSLATIGISDIESIEVLKDAASAAIYGSRATNGVVLITTKSGKEGRSDVKLNFSTGFSRFPNPNKIKLATSEQYIDTYNEGVDNYNRQYGYVIGNAGFQKHIMNPFPGTPDTKWLDMILRTGMLYNIDGSFSGGTSKTKYYIGAGYTNQEGIIRDNKIEKVNLKTRVSHEFKKWLEVGGTMSGNYLKNHQVPGANLGTTIIGRCLLQRPYDRPYKPDGSYYLGGTNELTYHNPIQVLNEQTAYFENYRFLGNFYAALKLFKDKLQIRTTFNGDMSFTYDYTYYNENHPYGTGKGRIAQHDRTIRNLLLENYANYNDKFGNFSFSAMLGHSFQKITTRASGIDGRGFPSPSFDVISAAAEIFEASGSLSDFVMESYFGRLTTSFKDRYMLTATVRTDGSSKFARAHRWGLFPSISFGWNVGREAFLRDRDLDLKFRVSYGRTGNQERIGAYAHQALMVGGRNYDGQSGIAVSTFGNEKLTWEKADQYDAGIDLALFKGRVNMIVDFYQKNTFDLLYNAPQPATTGTSYIMSNVGSMRNRGVEFTLNTHFNFGKFSWLSQFNIATNKNKITSLIGEKGVPMTIGNNRALQVGKEVGAFYLFKMDGIYQYDGEVPQEQYDLGIRAGDVKWHDRDNNGIINDNDRVLMGSSNPDFSGGWNNTFRYKGFQLDVFFTYMYGNDVYAEWIPNLAKLAHNCGVLSEHVKRRWTGPGSTNKYPRAIITGAGQNVKNSDRFLEDGSFIRLRSLTFSYELSKKALSKLHMKSLRVFFQGDNLFLLTKYKGWDPEVSNNMDPRFFGVDLFNVPQPRVFSFGINIGF